VPGSKLFLFIGMFMLIGALPGFKLAQVVSRLRKEMVPVNYGPSTGLGAGRSGDQLVPEDVATRIIERIHEAFPKALSNRVAAQYTLQAYESLNARPPGWLGTTALGGVHLASLFLAIVLAGWWCSCRRPTSAGSRGWRRARRGIRCRRKRFRARSGRILRTW
jgi:hypothetical protein